MMDMDDPGSVLARLEQVERRCRRWRRVSMACLVGSVLVVAGGARTDRPPAVVEAERFLVRDAKRNVRVSLGYDPIEARHELSFYDPGHKPRLGLIALTEPKVLAALSILAPNGRDNISVNVPADGPPSLSLGDMTRLNPVAICFDPSRASGFFVGNKESKSRILLDMTKNSIGLLIINRNGVDRLLLGCGSNSKTVLNLYSKPKNGTVAKPIDASH